MKKAGIAKMQSVHYHYGSVTEMVEKETQAYIYPKTVKLFFNGERLCPTQFDAHGNPQIGGVAHLILIWKLRQMAHDGKIDSQYDMQVEYSYETTTKRIQVPIQQRLPRPDICPVCGNSITLTDLNSNDEIVTDMGGGLISRHWERRVGAIESENVIAHSKCVKEFYRLRMIDEIARQVSGAFDYEWGKGENQMWYELIPNEYCSGECCAHRPWFLFHTPLGNVKIGWRKRVINITFMNNFVQFDLMQLFAEENVTKRVEDDGSRTIHAWGKDKLFEYLHGVWNEVVPKKMQPVSSK